MVAITRRAWLQGAAALAFTSHIWADKSSGGHNKGAGATSCAAGRGGTAFHQ